MSDDLDARFADFKTRLKAARARHWDDIRKYRIAQLEEYSRLCLLILMNRDNTSPGRVADRLGVPVSTITATLSGKTRIDLDDISDIAWACGGATLRFGIE